MRAIGNDVKLAPGVKVYDFTNLYGCEIGENTRIGAFVEIQRGARIGKNCKISSHSFICEGVAIDDEVFVGHNVTFINDLYPRATTQSGSLQGSDDWQCVPTVVERRVSIGSSATILAGVRVGEGALIGAGAVVTKDVAPWTVVAGNPARVIRTLSEDER